MNIKQFVKNPKINVHGLQSLSFLLTLHIYYVIIGSNYHLALKFFIFAKIGWYFKVRKVFFLPSCAGFYRISDITFGSTLVDIIRYI